MSNRTKQTDVMQASIYMLRNNAVFQNKTVKKGRQMLADAGIHVSDKVYTQICAESGIEVEVPKRKYTHKRGQLLSANVRQLSRAVRFILDNMDVDEATEQDRLEWIEVVRAIQGGKPADTENDEGENNGA